MPVSIHARIGLLCAIVPLGLQASENVYFGEVCVRVVDVGQGSAALIDAIHRLLVDTGPRFGSGDVGRSHILPILRSTGRHDLDLLLLSHTDLDQAGGMAFFRSYFDQLPVIGPDTCAHGHTWLWDGVRFTTLQAVGLISDNDRSCTLLIETERHTAYLSGDISARAEQALWLICPALLRFCLRLIMAVQFVLYALRAPACARDSDIQCRKSKSLWSSASACGATVRVGGITAAEHC